MTDAELSRQVALAIGWNAAEVIVVHDYEHNEVGQCCKVWDFNRGGYQDKDFDYRSPDVALPLLEWLHKEHDSTSWWGLAGNYVVDVNDEWIDAATLEEAIARAVIAVGLKP